MAFATQSGNVSGMGNTRTLKTLVAALAVLSMVLFGSAVASAQGTSPDYGGPTSTIPDDGAEVLNKSVEVGGAEANAEVQGSSLAFTGSDAVTLTVIALVAIALGGGMVLLRRRTANSQ